MIVLFIFIVMNNNSTTLSSTFETHSIDLKGVASGGSLKFIQAGSSNTRFISIETHAGESAEKVAQRLAKAINESTNIFGRGDSVVTQSNGVISKGNSIEGIPGSQGMFGFAGTEKGLGIPSSPTSLSCTYDPNEQKIILNWVNPPEKYDRIYIIRSDSPFPFISNPATSTYTIDCNEINKHASLLHSYSNMPYSIEERLRDLVICVLGFRNNTPSNVAVIRVNSGGNCQEECYGIQFSNNIAPNWSSWSTAAGVNDAAFEQGQKFPKLIDNKDRTINSLSTKPFYQIIKSTGKNAIHGVYRKFLGLIPGHSYRLTACINTLDMDSIEGDWEFSMYAVPEREKFTSQQMAYPLSLIENKENLKNIQVFSYGPNRTSKSSFDYTVTGYTKLQDGKISSNIVLSDKIDEITVWLKFVCEDPNGSVAFSGVKLEDITAIRNPKSPEQIIEDEKQSEINLLRRFERGSL